MAWIGAAITAGAGLVGNAMSQSSASSLNRDNRVWQTEMADTAMQRRVTDLKAAGLNPYLAVTGGGGAGGPAAMPAPMAQNPGQAWSQLGQQTSNAVQSFYQGKSVGAQVELAGAQASANAASANEANVRAAKMAGVDTDFARQNIADSQSMVEYRKLQGQATLAQANLNAAQTQQALAALPEIQARIDQLKSVKSLNEAQSVLAGAQAKLSGLNAEQVNWLMPSIVHSADNAARLSDLQFPEAKAKAEFWSSAFGTSSPYLAPVASVLKAIILAGSLVK